MIKTILLYAFGWRRTPERFTDRMAEYIRVYLKDREVSGAECLSIDCTSALSQLAYRRAKKQSNLPPRFIHYVFECECVARSVEAHFIGSEVSDKGVRSVLAWHGPPEIDAEAAKARPPAAAVPTGYLQRQERDECEGNGPSLNRVLLILIVGFAVFASIATGISVFRQ